MYPNIQAYDRGVMFSPEGRLFQVEYAKEAVRRGATSIGIVADTGIVFVAHKNITEPLIIPSTVQKIFKVDSFIGATYSGLVSDGLHVVNLMRNKTQMHRMVYDETESVEAVAREISEEMQMATQYGGLRPYAISLLIGGIDTEKRLYEVEPGASFSGYKADAIGSGKRIAEDTLAKEFKDDMEVNDAINLGVGIIKKINEKKLTSDNVDISVLTKEKGYSSFSQKEITGYL
ncbi:archaeal proteasome endopeptidase complex subunit alpha [Candidatus Marsarchaeota archaeon]|nr:archaeal proteasome endopeptidase complex subunit alpha [Candidatus Marsarchaeota archaeon]MCL5099609.1 archaeal proteasome endopeptidase complex subunit alpha [Candidatus Marsarchaeota archaeon]